MAIAKSTQRPGQSKEQTKLIAQGIQKGIEQYKKQQKSKRRDADKHRKKQQREKARQAEAAELDSNQLLPQTSSDAATNPRLPWILLLLSWAGFALYLALVP